MIPTSFLTVVTAVVCKKVLDVVFDDASSKTAYDAIKNHDTLCDDIIREMIRRDIKEAEQKEGDE